MRTRNGRHEIVGAVINRGESGNSSVCLVQHRLEIPVDAVEPALVVVALARLDQF